MLKCSLISVADNERSKPKEDLAQRIEDSGFDELENEIILDVKAHEVNDYTGPFHKIRTPYNVMSASTPCKP